MGKTSKIFDKFTDLKVSRQRKYQLRHPEETKEIRKRYVLRHPNRDNRINWEQEYYTKNKKHIREYQLQYRIKKELES